MAAGRLRKLEWNDLPRRKMIRLQQPSRHHFLLGAAAGYAGLALFETVFPDYDVVEIFDIPRAEFAKRPGAAAIVWLLAARDLSFATILARLAYFRNMDEMRIVILGGVFVWAIDAVAVRER